MDSQRLRIEDPHALSRKVMFCKFYPLFLSTIVFIVGCSAVFSSTVYELYSSPPDAPRNLTFTFNISNKIYTKSVPEICAGCKLLPGEEEAIKMRVFGFPFCVLFVLLLNFCSIVHHARFFSTYQKSCLRCFDPWLMMFCCFFMMLTCFFMFHPVLSGCSEYGSFPMDSDERFWYESDRGACRRRWNYLDSIAALLVGILSMFMYLIASITVCRVPNLSKVEGGELQSEEQQGVTYFYDPSPVTQVQGQSEGQERQPPESQQGLSSGGNPLQGQMQRPPGYPPPQRPPAPPSNTNAALQ